jgi:prostaglandin-endoperoxide synthase 2
MPAERAGLQWSRDYRVDSLNAYRTRFGLAPYASIDDLADEPATAAALHRLYRGNVDAVEYTIGLLAEKRGPSDVLPQTMTTIVAYDAFTHILTNPLLASQVNREATFSPAGWDILQQRSSLAQIIARNVDGPVDVSLSA